MAGVSRRFGNRSRIVRTAAENPRFSAVLSSGTTTGYRFYPSALSGGRCGICHSLQAMAGRRARLSVDRPFAGS